MTLLKRLAKTKFPSGQRGVAMMMALTTITILVVLAAELVYETTVYHRIVFNSVDQVRAQYLAKSGLKIARLQLVAAQKATQMIASFGQNAPVSQTDIDRIWQTPIILPPPLPSTSPVGMKDAVDKLTKELALGGTISINITGESGKLNLNRLIWLKQTQAQTTNPNQQPPREPGQVVDTSIAQAAPGQNSNSQDPAQQRQQLDTIRSTYAKIINEIFRRKKEKEQEFAVKYETMTGEMLIGNLVAWMDPNVEVDGDNSPKLPYYRQLTPPIIVKNGPLFSLSELHMVKDFDDTLVELLSDSFTASITDSINVNRVSTDLIRALFPSISDDAIEKFEEKRNLSPFAKIDDFYKFAQEQMGLGQEQKKALEDGGLTLDIKETAYRVIVDAKAGDARKVWLAEIGPKPPKSTTNAAQQQQQQQLQAQQQANPNTPNQASTNQQNSSSGSDGPTVIYLKAD